MTKTTTYVPKPIAKNEIVDRKCLKCGKEFKAIGRFNRLCDSCGRPR